MQQIAAPAMAQNTPTTRLVRSGPARLHHPFTAFLTRGVRTSDFVKRQGRGLARPSVDSNENVVDAELSGPKELPGRPRALIGRQSG